MGAVAGKSSIYIEDKRQQRNTLMLRDVRYRLWAKMEYRSVKQRIADGNLFVHAPGLDENPMKYYQMFERRAAKGQCFNQPYLGTRECVASFRLVDVENEILSPAIQSDRDLGIMLYDMDFPKGENQDKKKKDTNIQALFYRPEMKQGVIIVPPLNSENILR